MSKDAWMKVGIAAAVALIVYLVFRSKSCKDTFADYAASPDGPEDDYAAEYANAPEDEFAAEYAEYADAPEDDYAAEYAEYADAPEDDYAAEYAEYADAPEDDYAAEIPTTLMESTMHDGHANAAFFPGH